MIKEFEKVVPFEQALRKREGKIRKAIEDVEKFLKELNEEAEFIEEEIKEAEKMGDRERVHFLENKIVDIQIIMDEGREIVEEGENRIAEMWEKYQKIRQ